MTRRITRNRGLVLERLESRDVPTTFFVDNNADSGLGSLRQAIDDANLAPGADTIEFRSLQSGTITLASALSVTDSVSIVGPGADAVTISGNNTNRIFNINNISLPIDVTISDLKLADGNATDINGGGAIFALNANLQLNTLIFSNNKSVNIGGAIGASSDTSITVENSIFTGNQSGSDGGAIYQFGYTGLLRIEGSLFDNNTAINEGGAVYIDGSNGDRIENSTFTRNTADEGGAINFSPGNGNESLLQLINVTATQNTARAYGGISGAQAAPILLNSIIAGNTSTDPTTPDDLIGLVSLGGNVIGSVDPNGILVQQPSDIIGATNPGLAAKLADNGGPTPTLALLPGSPAIGRGVASGSISPFTLNAPPADQRGLARPTGGAFDAGAIQVQQPIGVATTFTTGAEQSLTIAAPGLLTNAQAVDPAYPNLTAIIVSQPDPATGTVNLNPDGSFTFTPAPGFSGIATFQFAVTNGVRASAPLTATILVQQSLIAIGTGAGVPSQIQTFNPDGTRGAAFNPFEPTFLGGVRVAVGDVNGDGVADIVAGAGPGGSPRVVIFDGKTNAQLASFFAYEDTFVGGVFVAVGNVTGDGKAEIVTGPGSSGGPRIRVLSFDPATGTVNSLLPDFFAFGDDPNFSGGARVAVGDMNGDGVGEIIVTPGPGGGPRATIYGVSGSTVSSQASFFVSGIEETFRGGLFVAAYPAAAGQPAYLVFGPDNFSGAAGSVLQDISQNFLAADFVSSPTLYVNSVQSSGSGLTMTPVASTQPFGPTFPEGIRVGTFTTSDGSPGIVAGSGEGGNGLAQFYRLSGNSLTPLFADPVTVFDPASLAFADTTSSVYVGGTANALTTPVSR
ncbi:MAG: cadherin-like domain-containing protein [Bacteroidales bacterium]|nr:cadherin-like domain-containing protein [Bacteroidales bacterium]